MCVIFSVSYLIECVLWYACFHCFLICFFFYLFISNACSFSSSFSNLVRCVCVFMCVCFSVFLLLFSSCVFFFCDGDGEDFTEKLLQLRMSAFVKSEIILGALHWVTVQRGPKRGETYQSCQITNG